MSLNTIYFTIILICIFILFGTRISQKNKNTSVQERKRTAAIFWPSIALLIGSFISISFITTGHVSMSGLIGFSCLVLYGGFVIVSILSRKNKNH